MEIELKLLFAPAELARLARLPLVRERVRRDWPPVRLRSVYFDTPDFALREAGVALRLRRDRGRWVQTVKAVKGRGVATAGLHQREETEFVLHARGAALPVPDPELLAQTPQARLFVRGGVREALAPAFETVFRRRVLELVFPDGTAAELAIDLGEIVAGPADAPLREPICEAELELSGGGAATLLRFAQELSEQLPFCIGHASKAERAWRLAEGGEVRPRKALPPALAEDMSGGDALRAVVGACLEQMAANEAGVIAGGDMEFLHQYRVGMRRLRVALALGRDPECKRAREALRAEMRWLGGALGPARNWDVFTVELLPPIARHCGMERLAGLRARAAARRRAAGRTAREALASPRGTRLWLSLGLLMALPPELPASPEDPAGPAATSPSGAPSRAASDARGFATKALARRYRRLLAHAPASRHPRAEALHRLRIEARKLRYTAEFFGALWPQKRVRRFLDPLAKLQEVLGAVNDAAVSQRMVDEAAGLSGRRPLDPALRGLAQGWIAAGEARARARFGQAWETFIQTRVFW